MAVDGHGRDLVVVGASAGGVEALAAFVAGLPAALPAAVMVVLHIPGAGVTALPAILDRCGPLPAGPARDGEPLLPGRVYVAVNDRHLLVKHDHVLLSRAPKQNRSRPAVDALFRSAARWRGARAIGVLLSGTLDDGAAGLAAIVDAGGGAVVQDPAEALWPGMPRAALAVVPGAVVRPAVRAGAAVADLVGAYVHPPAGPPAVDLVRETDMIESERSSHEPGRLPGRPAALSCPDCTGGMNLVRTGTALHYVCHVGHSWTPQALVGAQREKIEDALWTAISMLEEQAHVYQQLAERATAGTAALVAGHQLAAADEARKAAQVIRKHFPELLPVG
jgi:two-component system, chemotaxis family, protein-glutamate methylesterase/glutaminase